MRTLSKDSQPTLITEESESRETSMQPPLYNGAARSWLES